MTDGEGESFEEVITIQIENQVEHFMSQNWQVLVMVSDLIQ